MIYYTDGFTKVRNPSPVGGGYTIFNEKNELIEENFIRRYGFTNNEAELLGVLRTAEIASKGDTIITDSKCIMFWIMARNTKARRDLLGKIVQASYLISIKQLNLYWEPREKNLAGIFNEQKYEYDFKKF